MELSAALVADLSTLTEALDEPETDLARTVSQLARTAKEAVGSYLGLTIVATTGGSQVNLTALEDSVESEDIRTSLRFPLNTTSTRHADTGFAESVRADNEPGIELILYAGNPGALVDPAADLRWLTGRSPSEFVLDADLFVADHNDELARRSWTNRAIGILIGRGYTPEQAEQQLRPVTSQTVWDHPAADQLLTALLDTVQPPAGP